jgi:Methylamine utilisation protein MauE
MIATIREIQAPVLALILLGACGAKLARALRARSMTVGLGPTELFPRPLRRPVAIAVCSAELCLGVALIVTSGPFGYTGSADAVRLATALLFLIALCGLVELREHRPDLGCGCFGDLSVKPVGVRSIARTGLLAVAALASIGSPALRLPPPGPRAATGLGVLLAELLLVALLSPEAGEALMRLGYSEPCEVREVPARQALHSLHRSKLWRQQSRLITSDVPADMWRELCWWYVVYPAHSSDRDSVVVFAIGVKPHRPAIRWAIARATAPDGPRHPETHEWDATPLRSAVL